MVRLCCLLADPDMWKRMPLKCSITMVFTCPLLACPLSLKVDEPQVGQRHKDVERKHEYNEIIIFPEN